MKKNYNRWIYIGFLTLGLYNLFLKHNFGDATIYLGIALAFDPFDINQPWKERPKWQQTVLLVQLCLVFITLPLSIWPDLTTGFMEGFRGK